MGLCNSKESLAEDSKSPQERSTPSKDRDTFNLEIPGDNFDQIYTLGKKLGSGTFSVVKEGKNKKTGETFAIKCVTKAGLTKEDTEALYEEVSILKELKHPNIMILFDFFEEKNMFYLVTEKMEGGELFDRIVEKEYYTEKEARDVIMLLLDSINFCHTRHIVHRDLKPENLLLTSRSNDAYIKLADFGFAKKVSNEAPNALATACGTPGYVAPEILEGVPYGRPVDIWSIGVISYILLCGYPPFHDDNQAILFRKIKRGAYEFDSPYWDNVSDEAKDLIRKMLVVDPARRATAAELLRHPWICGAADVLSGRQLGSTISELKKFNARRKFKAGVDAVKAINRMKAITGAITAAARESQKEDAAAAEEGGEATPTAAE